MSKAEFVEACLKYQQAKKDAREDEYAAYRIERFQEQIARKARKYYSQKKMRKSYE